MRENCVEKMFVEYRMMVSKVQFVTIRGKRCYGIYYIEAGSNNIKMKQIKLVYISQSKLTLLQQELRTFSGMAKTITFSCFYVYLNDTLLYTKIYMQGNSWKQFLRADDNLRYGNIWA